jgi:hypothetical protein
LSLAESEAIDIRIPSVAIMESYKSWERDRERTSRVRDRLQDEISGVLDRKFVPEGAREYADRLDDARAAVARRLNQARARTARCISVIARKGKIIPLPQAWGLTPRESAMISAEPDDMILASVIADARTEAAESILLTENSAEFGQVAVKEALSAVGVRYMYDTADTLARIQNLLS